MRNAMRQVVQQIRLYFGCIVIFVFLAFAVAVGVALGQIVAWGYIELSAPIRTQSTEIVTRYASDERARVYSPDAVTTQELQSEVTHVLDLFKTLNESNNNLWDSVSNIEQRILDLEDRIETLEQP